MVDAMDIAALILFPRPLFDVAGQSRKEEESCI